MKNPITNWLCVIFTLGAYGPVWIYILSKNISDEFHDKRLKFFGFIGMCLGLMCFLVTIMALYIDVYNYFGDRWGDIISNIFFAGNISVFSFIYIIQIMMARRISKLIGRRINVFTIFILHVFYFLSIPYLQNSYNEWKIKELHS